MKSLFMQWLKPLIGASLALGMVGASTAGAEVNSSTDRDADLGSGGMAGLVSEKNQ